MNDRYDDMYQAASRYYVQGETMESIAHQLRLSRSSVSRLLKDARESGLVRISLADHQGSQSPLASAISRHFGVRVHMVSVRENANENVRFDQIKQHYYVVHRDINPLGIVPKGPDLAGWYTAPGRG